MYRIELAPGEETVFRTIEELAVGVRNGLVTSRSRIYHTASQKWLPIEFHPHYKKALELSTHRQDLPVARVPERLESLSFAVPRPAPAPPSPPAPPAEPEPVAPAPPSFLAPASEPVEPEPVAAEPVVPKPVVPEPVVSKPVVPKPVVPERVVARSAAIERVASAPVVETATVIRTKVEFPALAALADELNGGPAAARASVPPAVASPVLQFPAIVYPEITPADPPVAEPVTEAARSRRPLHLAGAVVVLALGGYGMMSFAPSRGAAAAVPAVADRPAMLPQPVEPAAAPADDTPAAPATSRPVTMTQPASSGFAPALEPRAIVSPSTASAAATPVLPVARDSSLAPAPIDLELEVPVIAGAESLMTTPKSRSDSAMKRILRAVNGGKDLPQTR